VKPVSLLDVNALIAAAWPTHTAHEKVQAWFASHAHAGWATCPLTELGFVRILSNPAFSPHALTPREAATLLQANVKHPAHHFWADDLPFSSSAQTYLDRLTGHQQVTDAYLLGMAFQRNGKLVTLDQSVQALLADKPSVQNLLLVL